MSVVSDSDIAAAAAMDRLTDACAMIERIAGIEKGSIVVQHIEDEIVWWFVFDDQEYRAERLRHWITVAQLWPALKIGKEKAAGTETGGARVNSGSRWDVGLRRSLGTRRGCGSHEDSLTPDQLPEGDPEVPG